MSKQKPTTVRRVTVDEQEQMGLRPQAKPRNSYVSGQPESTTLVPRRSKAVDVPAHNYSIQAAPSATLGSQTNTSATDRAKGYLMIQIPLAISFGVVVVAVAKALSGFPLFSFAAFLVFWLSFVIAWLIGWGVTLLLSAEGVAFYAERRKWNIIEREQQERWAHYHRQIED